jgi:hypothetical protein
LLPRSRIQLPLLTFGSRRTGKNITHTKTSKIPSKQANIGALGLKAKIPPYLTNTSLMFHVSLLSGADNNERASHFSPQEKAASLIYGMKVAETEPPPAILRLATERSFTSISSIKIGQISCYSPIFNYLVKDWINCVP